ncbi:MAG: BlaI/MecI/CopY family transcriptional regulator [Planctomycetaceae bacterium]|nr:BlaI/MecI/CopY family transcriptional regulator [Planctomycetaceae bacterium]
MDTAMAKRNTITEAEWPIMAVLWEKGTVTSAEIIDTVMARRDVTKRTLKALLNRLITKGSVVFTRDDRDQRVYHYSAAITREEAMRSRTHAVLDMVGGNALDLLASFVTHARLQPDDIAQLRELLDEKEKRDRR